MTASWSDPPRYVAPEVQLAADRAIPAVIARCDECGEPVTSGHKGTCSRSMMHGGVGSRGYCITTPMRLDHRDGVAWWAAPPPARRHEHRWQTRAWCGVELVERCACGAFGPAPWVMVGRDQPRVAERPRWLRQALRHPWLTLGLLLDPTFYPRGGQR